MSSFLGKMFFFKKIRNWHKRGKKYNELISWSLFEQLMKIKLILGFVLVGHLLLLLLRYKYRPLSGVFSYCCRCCAGVYTCTMSPRRSYGSKKGYKSTLVPSFVQWCLKCQHSIERNTQPGLLMKLSYVMWLNIRLDLDLDLESKSILEKN